MILKGAPISRKMSYFGIAFCETKMLSKLLVFRSFREGGTYTLGSFVVSRQFCIDLAKLEPKVVHMNTIMWLGSTCEEVCHKIIFMCTVNILQLASLPCHFHILLGMHMRSFLPIQYSEVTFTAGICLGNSCSFIVQVFSQSFIVHTFLQMVTQQALRYEAK